MADIVHAAASASVGTNVHPNAANALANLDFGTVLKLFTMIMSLGEIKNHTSGDEGVIDTPDVIVRTSKNQRIIITGVNYTVE